MTTMLCYIYRMYDCRNGMSYIGKASNYKKRIREHLNAIRSGNSNSKVYSYFKDVPFEYIKFEIIATCDASLVNEAEKFYIDKYNTVDNGLNTLSGGEGGSSKYTIEKFDKIYRMYMDGYSYLDIAKTFNHSVSYISEVISNMARQDSQIRAANKSSIKRTSNPKRLACYDKDFNLKYKFDSVKSAIAWLRKTNDKISDFNGYYRINQSTVLGNIAYGYRWQNLDDLIFDGMVFNTIFDVEAYKIGGIPFKNSNGLFEVENSKVSECRSKSTKTRQCIKCGKVISKYNIYGMCSDCTRHNSYKGRQVPYDLKISYPFVKEELQQLYPKYTVNSIAKHCSVSYTTVNKWLKKFGIK